MQNRKYKCGKRRYFLKNIKKMEEYISYLEKWVVKCTNKLRQYEEESSEDPNAKRRRMSADNEVVAQGMVSNEEEQAPSYYTRAQAARERQSQLNNLNRRF